MPFLLILLLLPPLLDIYLMCSWLWESTPVALAYLVATMLLGGGMIKLAKIGVGEGFRLMRENRASPTLIIRFIRIWLGGALLFFPGYLSDVLALLVLLFPGGSRPPAATDEQTLEVEAEEIKTDSHRHD